MGRREDDYDDEDEREGDLRWANPKKGQREQPTSDKRANPVDVRALKKRLITL